MTAPYLSECYDYMFIQLAVNLLCISNKRWHVDFEV